MKKKVTHFFSKVYQLFFYADNQNKISWVYWFWAGLLFLLGLYLWGYFIEWGSPPSLLFQDWTDITLPRLTFVQNALRQGVLPLHVADRTALGGVTDRYLTIPDLLLSPQVVLLLWLNLRDFIMYNLWLSYAAGFAGLLWLSRKYHLSSAAFTILFFLFNFNGHILSHLAVGHYTWTGYFLFPWLVGFILELFERKVEWKWVTKTALLLFLMLLQGGYHQYIWSLFLLVFLLPFVPQQFWRLVEVLVSTVLLSAVRLLPLFLNLGKFDTDFYTGYPTVSSIWDALVKIMMPGEQILNSDLTIHIGSWEYTFFIGLAAALFIVGFGLIQVIRNHAHSDSYAVLLLPVSGLVMLSLDRIYKYLRIFFPVPLLSGERVSSRILSLAFVIVLILAVMQFQKWFEKNSHSKYWGYIFGIGLIFMGHDLWQNFHFWQADTIRNMFERTSYNPWLWSVTNHYDPGYFNLLWAGLVVSVLTLAALIFFTQREKKTRIQPKENGQ